MKKTQIDEQTLGEAPTSAKTTPLSKDTKPDGRQGLKPTGVLFYMNNNGRDTALGIQYLYMEQHDTFFSFRVESHKSSRRTSGGQMATEKCSLILTVLVATHNAVDFPVRV